MIYTAPCVMLLMRAASITWASGWGITLEIASFLGPVKWHRADMRVPFGSQMHKSNLIALLRKFRKKVMAYAYAQKMEHIKNFC